LRFTILIKQEGMPMANDTDVLLKLCEEHWTEMRHIEDQRATITNIVIIITSAVVGSIAPQTPSWALLSLPMLLIILGIYAAVTTAKLYERHQFAQTRLDYWYKRIDELNPNAEFLQLRNKADVSHKSKYPRISKFHLHRL
jgi:hypothetical protein